MSCLDIQLKSKGLQDQHFLEFALFFNKLMFKIEFLNLLGFAWTTGWDVVLVTLTLLSKLTSEKVWKSPQNTDMLYAREKLPMNEIPYFIKY